jgi:hypothetical protein
VSTQLVKSGIGRYEVHSVVTTKTMHEFTFLGYLVQVDGMWHYERAIWKAEGHEVERNPRPFALREGALAALLRPVVMS